MGIYCTSLDMCTQFITRAGSVPCSLHNTHMCVNYTCARYQCMCCPHFPSFQKFLFIRSSHFAKFAYWISATSALSTIFRFHCLPDMLSPVSLGRAHCDCHVTVSASLIGQQGWREELVIARFYTPRAVFPYADFISHVPFFLCDLSKVRVYTENA